MEALRTGRGPTTRALDLIFTPPYSGIGFDEVQQADALNTPLADWGIDLMLNHGAGLAEVLHIDAWPNAMKESLRQEILAPAVAGGLKVRFFWEPHAGAGAVWVPREPAVPGELAVTFRTPRSEIVQTSVEEVDVGVGTAGGGLA
jgi:hypothetical protein